MKLRGKTKVAVDIDVAVFRLFLTAFVNILLFLLRTVVHRRRAGSSSLFLRVCIRVASQSSFFVHTVLCMCRSV